MIANIFTNIVAYYENDMISVSMIDMMSPSWAALQQLLDILELNCTKFDIVCNTLRPNAYVTVCEQCFV